MKVNMFNIWNDIDPRLVRRWLLVVEFLVFVSVVGCVVILAMQQLNEYIVVPLYFSPLMVFAFTFTPYGATISYIPADVDVLVYPLFSGFIVGVIAIQTILIILYNQFLDYAS